jgi:hypothetical protein
LKPPEFSERSKQIKMLNHKARKSDLAVPSISVEDTLSPFDLQINDRHLRGEHVVQLIKATSSTLYAT